MSENERLFLDGFRVGSWVSRDPGALENIPGCRQIIRDDMMARLLPKDYALSLFGRGLTAAYLSAWGF